MDIPYCTGRALPGASSNTNGRMENVNEQGVSLKNESHELLLYLAGAENRQHLLEKKLALVHSQVLQLAAGVRQSRLTAIKRRFPHIPFVKDGFESVTLALKNKSDIQMLMYLLAMDVNQTKRLYFLPKPPTCMPLHVPSCGRSGYWFYPLAAPQNCPFELVVQDGVGKWCYLGTYVTSSLPEHPMALSEWMTLDDEGPPFRHRTSSNVS